MPLARSTCCCRLLMRFIFPFQPRGMPAARASQLPWMISILSIPLGKYSALQQGMRREGGWGFFTVCQVLHGWWGWSWDREQRFWEGLRCKGSARLMGQLGMESLAPLWSCGPAVCSDLSAVCLPEELLLVSWYFPRTQLPQPLLPLFKKQLSLSEKT